MLTRLLLSLLTAFTLLSCSTGVSPVVQRLDEARAAISQNPDSALKLLNAIDRDSLYTERLRADHALLTLGCRLTLDLPASDSLVDVATTYYDQETTLTRITLQHLHEAQTALAQGHINTATTLALTSLRLADILADDYILAKAHDLTADIYAARRDTARADLHRTVSHSHYRRSGDTIEALYTRAQIIPSIITIISIFIVLGTAFYLFHNERMRLNRRRMEEQMLASRDLQSQLRAVSDDTATLRSRLDDTESRASLLSDIVSDRDEALNRKAMLVDRLFRDRFATLNTLSEEYFEKRESPQLRATIIRDFEEEIDKMKQPESIVHLRDIIDECHDGIITRLREQIPELRESDLTFLTFVLAGFSPRAVALFTDIKLGNYYNRRTRIRARIAASGAPDTSLFLAALNA